MSRTPAIQDPNFQTAGLVLTVPLHFTFFAFALGQPILFAWRGSFLHFSSRGRVLPGEKSGQLQSGVCEEQGIIAGQAVAPHPGVPHSLAP